MCHPIVKRAGLVTTLPRVAGLSARLKFIQRLTWAANNLADDDDGFVVGNPRCLGKWLQPDRI